MILSAYTSKLLSKTMIFAVNLSLFINMLDIVADSIFVLFRIF